MNNSISWFILPIVLPSLVSIIYICVRCKPDALRRCLPEYTKKYFLTTEEVESLRKLLLLNTFKEIHDIDKIIKQIPELSKTVNELLVDVKKLGESIENVQDAVHSHVTPDVKKNIFNEYKNVLKNHNDRLLSLQNKVEKYARDDWLVLPHDVSTPTERSSGANSFAGVDRSGFAASTVCARGEAVRTPSPCIELEALSRVKSTILLNNDIFESSTQTSVEK